MKTKDFLPGGAELLLAGVIVARATSYLFSKLILEGMGLYNLLALRFSLAFLLLAALFFRRLRGIDRKTLRAGCIMGGMFFLVVSAELHGLRHAPSSTVSFLVNTAIVFVPLLNAALSRRAPQRNTLVSAALCLAGVGLLTLGSGLGFGAGEAWSLLAALLYACTILVTDRLSHSGIDSLSAGVVQVGAMAALSLAVSFLTETPRLPASTLEWIGVVKLAVVCTGFGFTLQPLAQSKTSAEQAGLFCAINPLVAACLGGLVLQERLSPQGLLGALLILVGLVLGARRKRLEKRTA